MFFVDKYEPKNISDISFHKDELIKLEAMAKDESIPHIIFYGPKGSGKKTLIKMFLEMMYDKNVHKIKDSKYNVSGSGNTVTEIEIKQSDYHIVIEPNNNNFDRYLIQDVVKEYARRVQLNVFTTKKSFKTVLINNIENLSYYAQTSLRRTMEKYSDSCRFIACCSSLSRIIEPLRSRCYCFRISAPTTEMMLPRLINIAYKEKLDLTLSQYNTIIEKSEGNMKKGLWLLDCYRFGTDTNTTYEDIIDEIVKHILSTKLKSILVIRSLFYMIMITNINGSDIIRDVVDKLITNNKINDQKKINITEIAATYEYNLILGRREIIHLEAFVISVINILRNNGLIVAAK